MNMHREMTIKSVYKIRDVESFLKQESDYANNKYKFKALSPDQRQTYRLRRDQEYGRIAFLLFREFFRRRLEGEAVGAAVAIPLPYPYVPLMNYLTKGAPVPPLDLFARREIQADKVNFFHQLTLASIFARGTRVMPIPGFVLKDTLSPYLLDDAEAYPNPGVGGRKEMICDATEDSGELHFFRMQDATLMATEFPVLKVRKTQAPVNEAGMSAQIDDEDEYEDRQTFAESEAVADSEAGDG